MPVGVKLKVTTCEFPKESYTVIEVEKPWLEVAAAFRFKLTEAVVVATGACSDP